MEKIPSLWYPSACLYRIWLLNFILCACCGNVFVLCLRSDMAQGPWNCVKDDAGEAR